MYKAKKIKPKFITDKDGNKVEVILPIEVYKQLLEDIEDLAVRADRIDDGIITHEELLEDLKADGIINGIKVL